MAVEPAPKPRRARAFSVKPRNRVLSPNTPKFSKLKALKCFPEINQRILDGWPLSQIQKFVQNDRQEYTDVTPGSLVAVLQEYRSSLPPAVLAEKVPGVLPVFGQQIDAIREGLNELEELEKLYLIQMERIHFDFEKERTIKKMLTTMTPEIRAAKDILMARAQLKLDLGIDNRHLGTSVEVSVTTNIADNYASESVKKVLGNDNSRRKLLGVAERFLALAKDNKSETLTKLAQEMANSAAPTAAPVTTDAASEDVPEELVISDLDPDACEYPKDEPE